MLSFAAVAIRLTLRDYPLQALSCHHFYHGGEQLLFAAWWMVKGIEKQPQEQLVVVTGLGRVFGITQSSYDCMW